MAAIFPVLDLYSCIATKWSRHLGFCITYTALLMKTWRWDLQMRLTNWIFLEMLIVPRLANKHPALKCPSPPSLPYADLPAEKLHSFPNYFIETYFNISLLARNLWLPCRIWYRSWMSVEINRINYNTRQQKLITVKYTYYDLRDLRTWHWCNRRYGSSGMWRFVCGFVLPVVSKGRWASNIFMVKGRRGYCGSDHGPHVEK
jgi:hypothetical protein